MSNLTIFNFEHFQIQTIIENNEIFFRATQLAELLEYSNPHKAIKDHVDPDDLTKREVIDTIRRKQRVLFVNESGMYSLVLGSKLPSAKKVKRWVTSEVLPQIRKTGKYSLQNQQLTLPEPEKKYTFEFTEYELEQLAWLWFSHKRMNTLLAELYSPLNALGSTFSGTVYSHAHEYRHHYEHTQTTMQRLIEPFKHSTKLNWQRVIPRISPAPKQLDF
ncbi:P22AR C-terminal domain-containing protein [Avibacterium paragallinarum]|uniref:P22AR C-terminal domain-containing protein n=1 Tax=Avibacterium paragallinarum TaxID=728 RepID=UPI00397AB80F